MLAEAGRIARHLERIVGHLQRIIAVGNGPGQEVDDVIEAGARRWILAAISLDAVRQCRQRCARCARRAIRIRLFTSPA